MQSSPFDSDWQSDPGPLDSESDIESKKASTRIYFVAGWETAEQGGGSGGFGLCS